MAFEYDAIFYPGTRYTFEEKWVTIGLWTSAKSEMSLSGCVVPSVHDAD